MTCVAIRVGSSCSFCCSSTTLWHQAWSQLWGTVAAITVQRVRLLLLRQRLRLRLIWTWLVHGAYGSSCKLRMRVEQWVC
jgi:hypothetical protein